MGKMVYVELEGADKITEKLLEYARLLERAQAIAEDLRSSEIHLKLRFDGEGKG